MSKWVWRDIRPGKSWIYRESGVRVYVYASGLVSVYVDNADGSEATFVRLIFSDKNTKEIMEELEKALT